MGLDMIVGVPVWQDRVSPVFDTACCLLVVRREHGREIERKEFVLGALAADLLVRRLAELQVNVLLCAAISEPLRLALERGGVRVEPHLCGEVAALLAAFYTGNWRRPEFRMPGCGEGPRHKHQARHGSSHRAISMKRVPR